MFKPHECGDSRLKCIDCGAQVCPKCFVECPVGNRCKACSAKFSSHVLNVSTTALLKMFITAIVLGGAFGALQSIIPGGGIWMWLIVYAIGVGAGNVIHKVGGFKIGPKVLVTTTIGVIVGWLGAVQIMPTLDPLTMAGAALSPAQRAALEERKSPAFYRTAVRSYMQGTTPDIPTRLAQSSAAAQERLPEMVAALNRNEPCYVLTATTDGDSNKRESRWFKVQSASGDQLQATDEKAKSSEIKTVDSKDVIDWQFSGKNGTEGQFFMPEMSAAASPYATAEGSYKSYRMSYGIIDLIVFLAGIITVMSGQVPQLRLPFFRN